MACGSGPRRACGPCAGGFCLGGVNALDSCSASDYATPEVEIALLPGVAGAITASLAKHSPATATPTGPALQGAVDHARAWATAHCPATGDAWYYDDDAAPKQIELCGATCTTVSGDPDAKIEILLGCQTKQAT